MLGKLIKQEWRSTWKVPTLLIGILFLATILLSLSVGVPAWKLERVETSYTALLLILLCYAVWIGCTWGVILYLTIRYYKSMYTDEGYLTHTLPVTTNQLLVSKALNFWIWNLLTTAAITISVCAFVAVVSVLESGDLSFVVEIIDGFKELCHAINSSAYALPWQFFLISLLVCMVVTSLSGVLMIIGSVNIGQLWARHRVAGAVLVYIGIYLVQQFVLQILISNVMFADLIRGIYTRYAAVTTVNKIAWIVTVDSILFAVALYIASYFILKKRVNVE